MQESLCKNRRRSGFWWGEPRPTWVGEGPVASRACHAGAACGWGLPGDAGPVAVGGPVDLAVAVQGEGPDDVLKREILTRGTVVAICVTCLILHGEARGPVAADLYVVHLRLFQDRPSLAGR